MSDRTSQLNVTHTLPAYFGQGNFNTTLFTNNAAMLHAFVLTAQTLVIFYRAKNLGAEKTFTLRLEGAVVNGFWLFNFTKRPGTDHLRRRKTDANVVKFAALILLFEQID